MAFSVTHLNALWNGILYSLFFAMFHEFFFPQFAFACKLHVRIDDVDAINSDDNETLFTIQRYGR